MATLPRTSNGAMALTVLTPRLPLTSTITGLASPVVVPLSILITLPEPAVDLSLSASPDVVTTSSFANLNFLIMSSLNAGSYYEE